VEVRSDSEVQIDPSNLDTDKGDRLIEPFSSWFLPKFPSG